MLTHAVETAVPQLFGGIYSRIMEQVDSSLPARWRILHWAISTRKGFARQWKQRSVPLLTRVQFALAERFVFSKLKERTGGRMRFFAFGGAALAKELGESFGAVGTMIVEGYGVAETSVVLAENRADGYEYGTVGKANSWSRDQDRR